MEKWKKGLHHLVICVVLTCLVWGGYWLASRKIHQVIEGKQINDLKWVVQIEDILIEDNSFSLCGVALQLDSSTARESYEIVLHNLDSGEYIFSKMRYIEFDDERDSYALNNHKGQGFCANIRDKIDFLESGNYEILIKPRKTKIAYQFSNYLSGGQLVYVNPEHFEKVNAEGTALEKIVEEGKARAYRPDIGMYVYQFKEEIYYITDEKYEFAENGSTYIDCMVAAFQNNEEINSSIKYYNCDFFFEQNEIMKGECGKYRVAKIHLPADCSVAQIVLGQRANDKWTWQEYVHLPCLSPIKNNSILK